MYTHFYIPIYNIYRHVSHDRYIKLDNVIHDAKYGFARSNGCYKRSDDEQRCSHAAHTSRSRIWTNCVCVRAPLHATE